MNWYRPPGPSAPLGSSAPFEGATGADAALGSGETRDAPVPRPRRDDALRLTRRRNLLRPHFPSPAITPNEAIAQCGALNTARAQTAYLQGNGPKLVQGMLRGAMGGLELSEFTVFWNFIDSILEYYCQTQASEFRSPG